MRGKKAVRNGGNTITSWAFIISGVGTLPFYLAHKDMVLWTAILFLALFMLSYVIIQKILKTGEFEIERKAGV